MVLEGNQKEAHHLLGPPSFNPDLDRISLVHPHSPWRSAQAVRNETAFAQLADVDALARLV